ncbi:hypothetical protein MGG_17292 [Pyricularia oryzae 70-15]|uniref:Uncharacterized protein n=1 Tax=Pyricularia oryzae (strain 70-15 / ATCC MYA-4617 / FGSC 8958) TaxID=242507 RepID=G4NBJ6_PYRO7|nr:uncharacterized protein MGG_17292 [Pyricularia oryzae 70-15]EHA48101.1 hypothetical protein MGG_17292 [Pyricularia oryzae 70-15]
MVEKWYSIITTCSAFSPLSRPVPDKRQIRLWSSLYFLVTCPAPMPFSPYARHDSCRHRWWHQNGERVTEWRAWATANRD